MRFVTNLIKFSPFYCRKQIFVVLFKLSSQKWDFFDCLFIIQLCCKISLQIIRCLFLCSEPPFHLSRRGWGEFPVRVQIHFKDPRNKKIDIIHNLKVTWHSQYLTLRPDITREKSEQNYLWIIGIMVQRRFSNWVSSKVSVEEKRSLSGD